jgi:hypothetical protein
MYTGSFSGLCARLAVGGQAGVTFNHLETTLVPISSNFKEETWQPQECPSHPPKTQ